MKITLMMAPAEFGDRSGTQDLTVFPLAIYHLAGMLHREGFATSTIDPVEIDEPFLFGDGIEARIAGSGLVGFSVNTFNIGTTRQVVRRVREIAPATPCLIGGVHPSYFPEKTLRFTGADFALTGESDLDIVHLARALEDGGTCAQVPNLHRICPDGSYWCSAVTSEAPELEPLPWSPYLDDLPAGVYRAAPFESSRGCRFACTFCSILGKHHWRPRQPETVVNALERFLEPVQQKVLTNGVLFTDDCFTADPERAAAILSGIVDRKLPARLFLMARIHDVLHSPALMEQLVRVQPYALEFGIECGYDEGMRRIRKSQSIRSVLRCMDALRERGVTRSVRLSFIIGFPFETLADIERTLAFAAYCMETYDCAISVAWWIPAPSRLWDELDRYGIRSNEDHFCTPRYERDPMLFRHYHANISTTEMEKISAVLRIYYSMGLSLIDIHPQAVNRPQAIRRPPMDR
jgi:anaerobic magnesium-protoporphyrin IX monomethyl ester cyclase